VADSLGSFLHQHRNERGLSLRALGKLSGVPYAAIHKIENGSTTRPQTETLERLAKALKISYEALERLSRGLPAEPRTIGQTRQGLDQVTAELLDVLNRLPIPIGDREFLRTTVVNYLDRFANEASKQES
jgi:transcriptional regulator with XRE-family HTH domain